MLTPSNCCYPHTPWYNPWYDCYPWTWYPHPRVVYVPYPVYVPVPEPKPLPPVFTLPQLPPNGKTEIKIEITTRTSLSKTRSKRW